MRQILYVIQRGAWPFSIVFIYFGLLMLIIGAMYPMALLIGIGLLTLGLLGESWRP